MSDTMRDRAQKIVDLGPHLKDHLNCLLDLDTSESLKRYIEVTLNEFPGQETLTERDIIDQLMVLKQILEEVAHDITAHLDDGSDAHPRSDVTHRPGMMSRMFGGYQDFGKVHHAVVIACLRMLGQIAISRSLEPQVELLRTKLTQRFSIEKLPDVLDQLGNLLIQSTKYDKEKAEQYLEKLSTRLGELQQYLALSSESGVATVKNTETLNQSIQEGVSEAKSALIKTDDIHDLSQLLERNLDNMLEEVNHFCSQERKKAEQNVKKIKMLEQRLADTEIKADAMRSSLNKQKYRSTIDSLTKLPNREAYNKRVKEAILRFNQEGRAFALAVADVDFFKKINDEYGHLAGDKVLIKVANLISHSVRSVDLVARYGGEEFVIILDRIQIHVAEKICNRILTQLVESHFHFRKKKVQVTMSIGVTDCRQGDSIYTLFDRADKSLYEAKNSGKNKVIVSP